ncbi:dnaJ homolog subfamily C member 30, mitochondrial [Pieris brassicae]|uniref:dnaJ homolog subfamily C member 30, mitochondrial n=1 Tax=Pieris brassicae TaxID=7116 RepID=UPI001E662720|nr:dnaJ homolog subfamily C member 30, mitochondrial [Pieris brassicae]
MGSIQKLSQNKSRLVCGFSRMFGTSPQILTSHYDALGITPNATQRDIKSAYYKLSKLYHPDLSTDEESAKKFRAITEAYEVLGNINLKKMYDKGLMVGRHNDSRIKYKPDVEPTDPTLKFYKSRTKRHITPTIDGKTPIYDFDAWSKQHYGEIFKKNQRAKNIIRTKKENADLHSQARRQESIVYFISAVGFLFIVFVAYGTTDYDENKLEKSKIKVESENV